MLSRSSWFERTVPDPEHRQAITYVALNILSAFGIIFLCIYATPFTFTAVQKAGIAASFLALISGFIYSAIKIGDL